jgi:TolB-like protein/Tfp pilus assembly protein PilF
MKEDMPAISPEAISPQSVRAELKKILASETFRKSERMSRFLRFVVEQSLAGRADELKEYTIGIEVFDRGRSYNPQTDSVVRVEAGRLRSKLRDYYGSEGQDDAVIIELPKGSYVPVFQEHAPPALDAPRKQVEPPGRPRKYMYIALAAVLLVAIAAWTARSLRRQEQVGSDFSSIAVLPFVNLSSEQENEYFSDGLTDELIHALARVPDLHVISETSSFAVKGKRHNAREVGRLLNVGALVEGSVRRTGDRVRITAQLIRVSDDRHLWTESFDRRMADIFAAQEEIADAIVRQLRAKLPVARSRPSSTNNLEAYHAYLKGRYFWKKFRVKDIQQALSFFQEAIEKDPGFASAHAGVADSYDLLGVFGGMPWAEARPKARAAARKALEIDASLAEAHTTLAHLSTLDWDWKSAAKEFRQALALNPNYATARQFYANNYLTPMRRLDEALGEMKRAQELDPLSAAILTDMGWIYFCAREYDRAIEQYRKALELEPEYGIAKRRLARAYEQKGRFAEATAQLPDARRSVERAVLAVRLGRKSEARQIVQEFEHLPEGQKPGNLGMARVYAALGQKDRAFAFLEKAYEEHATWLFWINAEPDWDGVRSDPRFQALIKKIGLVN